MIERSAGFVLFKGKPHKYLFLRKRRSLDFPKGKLERGETPLQAATRETFEEAGLRVSPIPGFLRIIHYTYRRDGHEIKKTVTFYLARVSSDRRVRISSEHTWFTWLSPAAAARELRHKNAKELVREAEEFLQRERRTS